MAAPQPAGSAAELLESLRNGATVVTANQRAARSLRTAFDQQLRAAGQTRWSPPQVFELESWQTSQWHRLTVAGYVHMFLLNPAQEHALWRQIIAADSETEASADPDAHAELAAAAWRAVWLAGGEDRLASCAATGDGKAFLRWARAFSRQLQALGGLSGAQLPGQLRQSLAANRSFPLAPELPLADFDDLTPAATALFEQIERNGTTVRRLQTRTPRVSAQLYTAPDDAAELRACARWLRERLGRHPDARLAVVVPNLRDRRAAIERAFHAAGELPFEFSLGRPLASTALAATALALLRWPREPLPLETLSFLLRSPYCGGRGAEALAAAEFDASELRTRTRLRPELSLEATIASLERSRRRPRLLNLLYRLRQLRDTAAGETPATFAGHADQFRACLHAAGCSLAPDAGSTEFQLGQRWESALDEVATLDATSVSPVSAGDALAALTRIARTAIFAPESRDAPIQVLGPLELGAVACDALWFLSADDATWPPRAQPQPLLPWRLQHELGIPGAHRERDLARVVALTERIAGNAPEVVFSYARHTGEGERRPSSLLRGLALTELPPFAEPTPAPPGPLEILDDTTPLPLIPADQPVDGGARLLELQAACGFRAFAELRVWSKPLQSREPGFDARELGNIVHRTMEEFWRATVDQNALKQLDAGQRAAMLEGAIAAGLARAQVPSETTWDAAYLEIQRRRLHDLLGPWLDLEARRPPFAVLQQETTRENVRLGPLTVRSLRADRIDETEGGLLLIDYKTSKHTTSAWLTDRPEQPQLPLYATVLSAAEAPAEGAPAPSLAGVAFAVLSAGKDLKLSGFAGDKRVLADPAWMEAPTFPAQIAAWQDVLARLAEAFVTGEAQVDPRSYPATCKHCEQRLFCRLDPGTLAQVHEEDAALDGELDD